jgi:hypothetical protein
MTQVFFFFVLAFKNTCILLKVSLDEFCVQDVDVCRLSKAFLMRERKKSVSALFPYILFCLFLGKEVTREALARNRNIFERVVYF